MLTGTPFDLTPFGSVLKGIGILYWLFVFAMVGLALFKIKKVVFKIVAVLIILIVTVSPVAIRVADLQEKQRAHQAKFNEANKIFERYCKNTGEHISKKIDNVDGIFWLRWRKNGGNQDNQFDLDDPYGHDCGGDDCIKNLLRVSSGFENDPEKKYKYESGYKFVEAIDPTDLKIYRYSLRLEKQHPGLYGPNLKLDRELISGRTARYGITWDDVSTREDREHWIAGGALRVMDLNSNEVIAERIGYMMDPALGDRGGFRSPWGYASNNACPAKMDGSGKRTQIGFTEKFIKKVLFPN